jgi:hypothetical protein
MTSSDWSYGKGNGMYAESAEIRAARQLTDNAASLLSKSSAFRQLDPTTQSAILRDVSKIKGALRLQDAGRALSSSDPYALSLETPEDFYRRRGQGPNSGSGDGSAPAAGAQPPASAPTTTQKPPATETLAARAGALSDEINFPKFVAGLVHGTFDAIVDATIRQMEAFADLVSAVAKDVDQFTSQNVSLNQARDWLVQHYPKELALVLPTGTDEGEPSLHVRGHGGQDEEPPSPDWLADFGLQGEQLTDELVEEQLVPAARRKVGENRMQTLATMVLLGMNRVIIKDGTISAKVRFRASAADKTGVIYAVNSDPGGAQSWGQRGSDTYDQHSTMVSTVGVNVQSDTELNAELFGEVRINFASETLPLERFADSARITLLQHNARTSAAGARNGAAASLPAPSPVPATTVPATSANPAVAPPTAPSVPPLVPVPPTGAPSASAGGR